jgi:2-dehydropantoate 2-reductase
MTRPDEVRPSDNARILVVGAGVNGSACAVGLFAAGFSVTVLARGQRYHDVRDDGIVIDNPLNDKRSVTRVPVIDRLDPGDRYDFVLVVVRKNQVADLLPVLAQNRSPNIVFMCNNLLGADDFIAALGKDRVMLGFVFAGGKRDGNVIRAFVVKSALLPTPFGEVDGTITPRLKRLVGIFRQAGFGVRTSGRMPDFLTTHATGVALLAPLLMKHGCDTSALARSPNDLRLFVDARREVHRVLRASGHTITPWTEAAMAMIPAGLQIAALRLLLTSKLGQVGCSHVSEAPDEMRQLALELKTLVDRSGLPVPAIRKVLSFVTPPLP